MERTSMHCNGQKKKIPFKYGKNWCGRPVLKRCHGRSYSKWLVKKHCLPSYRPQLLHHMLGVKKSSINNEKVSSNVSLVQFLKILHLLISFTEKRFWWNICCTYYQLFKWRKKRKLIDWKNCKQHEIKLRLKQATYWEHKAWSPKSGWWKLKSFWRG